MTVADRWNDDHDAVLRRLWAQALPASEIGARMGRTRNAVIGRASRLGLPARRQANKRTKPGRRSDASIVRPRAIVPIKRVKRATAALPQAAERVPAPVPQPKAPPTRWGDMAPGQCRNIIGIEEDVFDRSVCGAMAMTARDGKQISSYCAACHQRMFTPYVRSSPRTKPHAHIQKPRCEREEAAA